MISSQHRMGLKSCSFRAPFTAISCCRSTRRSSTGATTCRSHGFAGDAKAATHVAFGWRKELLHQHTDLQRLTIWAGVKALFWPSQSCLHVSLDTRDSLAQDVRSVKISAARSPLAGGLHQGQFSSRRRGLEDVDRQRGLRQQRCVLRAHGRYHCFNTCNCWTGRALQAADFRAGWFTPLPRSQILYLPESGGALPDSVGSASKPIKGEDADVRVPFCRAFYSESARNPIVNPADFQMPSMRKNV